MDTQNSAMTTIVPTTTFAPGIRNLHHASAMDLAVAAVSPNGLPLALIPVYKLLHGFILKTRKVDISGITAKAIITIGALFGIKFLWDWVKPGLVTTFTSSITLPIEHRKGIEIQEWLASQTSGAAMRHVKYDAGRLKFNKASQAYELSGAKHTNIEGGWFFFEGNPLYFQYHEQNELRPPGRVETSNGYQSKKVSGHTIRISCLGFSGGILSRLMEHVGAAKVADANTTLVFEVSPRPDTMGYGRGNAWACRAKPTRSLDTIDLDEQVKKDFLADIERFLHPNRQGWYTSKGIPYRRGFIFHGSPGTGKSSVAYCLAGHLGSCLYRASLNDIEDESHLKELFSTPEKGDILLLEDIDSSGIGREKMVEKTVEKMVGKPEADSDSESTMTFPGRMFPGHMNQRGKKQAGTISLSGLLNAIDTSINDGVILILTTNDPETLDKALIRPGRIDKQVLFGHISKAVAESIFVRMYQEDGASADTNNTRIAELAKEFASKISEGKLTPAEVQGFLIPHALPEDAIAAVEKWAEDVVTAKVAGKNIIGDEESTKFQDSIE